MKITDNVKNVRRTTLAIAALALLPLGAGAMPTDHDTRAATVASGLNTDLQRSESVSKSLALRFGAFSGYGEQASATETVGSTNSQPGRRDAEPIRQLP